MSAGLAYDIGLAVISLVLAGMSVFSFFRWRARVLLAELEMSMAAVDFLREIGLSVVLQRGVMGFAGHCRIVGGGLVVDPWLCRVSTILHEAGHLAIVPGRFRSWLNDDLLSGLNRAYAAVGEMQLDSNDPLQRAMLQTGDCEATAWAWAVGWHLGLKPSSVVRDEEYGGTGEEVRAMLTPSLTATRTVTGYFGIHGLAHGGFCALSVGRELPMYPRLAMWLQTE